MAKNGTRPVVNLPVGGAVLEFTIHDRLSKARAYYAKTIGYSVTQDEFAELLGCSGATVSNYELGNVTRLSDTLLREWARVTGVDYRWLKHGTASAPDGPAPDDGGKYAPWDSNPEPAVYGENVVTFPGSITARPARTLEQAA